MRAADRARNSTAERRAYLARNTRRWRERNPEKYAAQVALNNAVRAGKIKRQPCEVCGASRRVHGHHDDYSKPLKVRWLCPLHHAGSKKEGRRMKVTHNQRLILATLAEHKASGGRGIATAELNRELDRRHNRTMGYDALHSALVRMEARGLVRRDKRRPSRWQITAAGSRALA